MAGEEDGNVHRWDIGSLLRGKSGQSTSQAYAAILLNQSIPSSYRAVVQHIWEKAAFRLCADGGANVLYDCFGKHAVPPHEIRGDLDSLRPDVQEYFHRQFSTPVVKAASLYATDLQKCILRIDEEEEREFQGIHRFDVIILGGLSGRLDQTMHTLHVLCQVAQETIAKGERVHEQPKSPSKGLDEDDRVVLHRRPSTFAVSENSIAWILTKGEHYIQVDHSQFGPTCGLLPFAASVGTSPAGRGTRIWTRGLKWNLDGEVCTIGGFLSTSNHLQDDYVYVKAEAEIVWTMEIRDPIS